jgi:hypothetical protein
VAGANSCRAEVIGAPLYSPASPLIVSVFFRARKKSSRLALVHGRACLDPIARHDHECHGVAIRPAPPARKATAAAASDPFDGCVRACVRGAPPVGHGMQLSVAVLELPRVWPPPGATTASGRHGAPCRGGWGTFWLTLTSPVN